MRLHRAAQRASCAVLHLPRPPSAEIGVLQAANNKLRFQDEQMKARRSVTVPFTFRGHSGHGSRKEINETLKKIDPELGQTLFVSNSSIKPDGGIIEVQDDNGDWRVVLVAEAKHQGKDVENIKKGILVGTNNDQDLMAAGNAIERSHKNISEIANFMLSESHFPYVLFLEGSNFLTETISITRPDGRVVELEYNSGILNRLDRLTTANYGMPINTNLCVNKFIKHKSKTVMLQAASIYSQGRGERWDTKEMYEIMLEISRTSLKAMGSDLFTQITSNK